MKVLVLGASGMIGRTMFHVLSQRPGWEVCAIVRAKTFEVGAPVVTGIDLSNQDHMERLFAQRRPDVVVNCAGLTKHLPEGNAHIPALTMNALLPHRLAQLCDIADARLIHVSTDCVFSGDAGNYKEQDTPDATDVYGRTKALGEVTAGNALTLRTSTIGHEHGTQFGLLEWFLAQTQCKGFRHAIFSGLPTVEFARVVRDIVIPDSSLKGLYHVGASPIDKLSLLQTIARVYKRDIAITVDEEFRIDRSLNADKFAAATGYRAPAWPVLIEAMYEDHTSRKQSNV
ncbi:SDR family oxidoreductase [Herbaspirillum seropedicae]|uniref:dTDP-4-dehydrorhamnose reductase n=1 Tax=Herbaspirillum seropedicae (strain SmR1) TaxID=757424 RepID=D8IUF5_HERSS|nr:SDR family oxidoreductase [Herbaspirillum seropedicae]ADJ65687.1 dTDP-4-dehydrorhamnose reductase protein [Herbaspirillum seropedicae SmR1]AKN67500.1 dTDP-4-dehydrorhamnose reductase [Herbaspirillum seropedicae]NQE32089.1 dTDP-4-dehydrorhamnose reductase [Herbaspirillum seropedicae]UMU23509.1 SDR family oxidoreductase [Herbaspirillum seropedicae]